MIYFDNVSKVYPDGLVALEAINFSVKPGELVSVVGHSGAGKTTLLKMLLAEESPTDGAIFFESVNISALKPHLVPEYRRRIGTIFQDYKLLSNKTAYENVAFAMEAAGKPDELIATDVPEALALVGLGRKMWNFPHELSGGEKQRVAIARALINQPDVIIADEPTGNLDPSNTIEVAQILKKINSLGTTVVITTHDKDVVNSIQKRVVTLEGGKIIRDDEQGTYIL